MHSGLQGIKYLHDFVYFGQFSFHQFILLAMPFSFIIRKENVQINEEMREFYKKHFMNLFGQKLRSKDNKNPLDASQQQIFETVLRSVDYNTLYQWVRRVVKQQTRETRVNELLSRGKGLFYSSSSEDTTITLEQMQEIERVIEEQLENSKKDAV